ncbi:MAG: PAS domain S-box protein [Polyangiaceae bacterium]|nr:PAS domain S-box protein [Polyangiaceae bacterium]
MTHDGRNGRTDQAFPDGAETAPPPSSERRAVAALHRKNQILAAIHQYAFALGAVPSAEDILRVMAEELRVAMDVPFVVLCAFDATASELVVRYASYPAPKAAALARILGGEIEGLRLKTAPALCDRLRRQAVGRRPVGDGRHGDAAEIVESPLAGVPLSGAPVTLARAITEVFGPVGFFSVALAHQGELFATFVAAAPRDQRTVDDDELRAFASVSASALGRWLAERDRIESEACFRAMVDGMRDVVWRTTPDLVFTYVSPSVRHLIGYEPSEVAGRSLFAFLSPEGKETMQRLREVEGMVDQGPFAPIELPVTHRHGQVVWVEVMAVPQRDDAGRITSFQGITRDISARKRTEAERIELTAELHQAMKMDAIGRLAGGIAHDFNNLLMGILGNIELVADDLPPDHPGAGPLADAQLAAESAAALTRQLLSFSRKQMIQPRVIDPNEVVDALRNMVARLIGEDVTVEWSLDPNVGHVRIDPGQLEQVLVNLLVNSRDAMPRGGIIRVLTERASYGDGDPRRPPAAERDEYVVLRVVDNGIGMDDSTRRRVFEPFFTTKPQGRGTGLGLATTYGAVRRAGGFIEVTSAPGRGATFSIHLPVEPNGGALPERTPPTVPPSPVAQTTVLLVEDEQVVRGVTRRILERLGYVVVTAASAEQALDLAGGGGIRFDILMADVALPGMTGVALAGRVAELQPGIRVLFTSGHPAEEVVRGGVGEDGRSFIGKPFTPRALAERLRALLLGSRPPNP